MHSQPPSSKTSNEAALALLHEGSAPSDIKQQYALAAKLCTAWCSLLVDRWRDLDVMYHSLVTLLNCKLPMQGAASDEFTGCTACPSMHVQAEETVAYIASIPPAGLSA